MMASDMAETWRNCFEEELICPICLHVFSDPIQLPCKHNFCRGCISEAWAKDSSLARCPECNHAYTQKPSLEKNHKLSNIVEKYNALSVEKATTPALQCILCRRGPPLPAVKVCLRCNAPCCQSHVQTHLQQPCSALGHLLVEAEAVKAWTCLQHDKYRLYHCEAEQTAVCQYCCFARCHPSHGHAVTDVELRRNDIRVRRSLYCTPTLNTHTCLFTCFISAQGVVTLWQCDRNKFQLLVWLHHWVIMEADVSRKMWWMRK